MHPYYIYTSIYNAQMLGQDAPTRTNHACFHWLVSGREEEKKVQLH